MDGATGTCSKDNGIFLNLLRATIPLKFLIALKLQGWRTPPQARKHEYLRGSIGVAARSDRS